MSKHVPVVAICGRTNVGKSSLFNALVGKALAVVKDEEGVTRDRNYALVGRYDIPFTLVDTGGLVGEEQGQFWSSVKKQAKLALEEADLVLAMVDGMHGVHHLDKEVAKYLRVAQKPVIWVINKCEKQSSKIAAAEFYGLGIEDFVCISAAHRVGLKDLVKAIESKLATLKVKTSQQDRKNDDEQISKALKVAILGRPNVGKSTMLNRLIGKERAITSEKPGSTRDTIRFELKRDHRDFVLFDTAGLRKKAKVHRVSAERFSNLRSLRALAECDIAVLLLDATQGLPSDQDSRLASLISERGRGLIIAVNKWDAIEKDKNSAREYQEGIRQALKQVAFAPIVFVSALSGQRCPSVLDKALEIYEKGKQRVPTAELNKALKLAVQRRQPPSYRGEPLKIQYATQIGVLPPEFTMFVSSGRKMHFSYLRYLKNCLREMFDFEGYDIKLHMRTKSEKPRSKKRSGKRPNQEFRASSELGHAAIDGNN